MIRPTIHPTRRPPTYGRPTYDTTYRNTCLRMVRHFSERPGLRLTVAQAQRLWNLEAFACEAMLGALVDAGFLVRGGGDTFLRSEDAFLTYHPPAGQHENSDAGTRAPARIRAQ